jgi:hypothetical protein
MLCSAPAFAVTAVLEVNEDQWYSDHKFDTYGGAELTSYYAPLPVFFEGWKSTPREDIVEYRWDFGDGSPVEYGFNGAHVYEAPGNYTCVLTVKDSNGNTDTANFPVEVLERDGITYYVDSDLGDDSNAGTSPGAGAWRTATHVFKGMNDTRYKKGDQVLFKRGQTFELMAGQVSPGHNKPGHSYMFGAHGTGAKPVLQYTTGNGRIINLVGKGLGHFTMMDLKFVLENSDGQRPAELVFSSQDVHMVLFYRLELENFGRFATFSQGTGPGDLDNRASNIFLIGNRTYDGLGSTVFWKVTRGVLKDNNFELCTQHLNYLSYTNVGLVKGNRFAKPAFGRTALRVCADSGSYDKPSNNVYIAENMIEGWRDPRTGDSQYSSDGTRFNYRIVDLSPNAPNIQRVTDVLFENNVITDAETILAVGTYDNLVIRNNFFSTKSRYASGRIQIGDSYEKKPLTNIKIHNNYVVTNPNTGGNPAVFHVRNYTASAYNGLTTHQDIDISDNWVHMQDEKDRHLYFTTTDAGAVGEVGGGNNRIYTTSADGLFQTGGAWTGGGTVYSLSDWQGAMSEEASSLVYPVSSVPTAGTASAPASSGAGPVTVSYSGAQAAGGMSVAEVRLWVRRGFRAWYDTGLTSSGASGSFSFNNFSSPDTYYFAVQTVDNQGNRSVPPLPDDGVNHAATEYAGGGASPPPDDTTAPSAGTASAPASAGSSPIIVSYSGASDSGSGLNEVRLWVKKGSGGTWNATNLTGSGSSGSFDYVGMTASDTYYFATRAEDYSGNFSATPTGSGDDSTAYTMPIPDTTPPVAGTASSPASDDSSPITVSYTGASDADSGLKAVKLWVKKGSSAWQETSLSETGASGNFAYTGMTETATYHFATRAEDNAGNFSATPSGSGDSSTAYTYTAPAVPRPDALLLDMRLDDDPADGVVDDSSPHNNDGSVAGSTTPSRTTDGRVDDAYEFEFDNNTHVDLNNLDVTGGDGLTLSAWCLAYGFPAGGQDNRIISKTTDTSAQSHLWLLSSTENGDGVKLRFRLKTEGNGTTTLKGTSGNLVPNEWFHACATWDGSTMRLYKDGVEIGSVAKTGTLATDNTVPAWVGANPGSSTRGWDGLIDEVKIYNTALTAQEVAQLAAATGGGGSTDTTAPVAGSVSAPAAHNGTQIPLDFSGASDSGSGLASVELWARKDSGSWAATGLSVAASAGTFNYQPAGDGTYYFATRAVDADGNQSALPTGSGGASTEYDTTAPTAATVSTPQAATSAPIAVNYSGASDSGSGVASVELWMRKGSGNWAATGATQSAASGSFDFAGVTGDDTYYFAARTTDVAGNRSAIPTGAGDAELLYDSTPPVRGALSAPTTSNSLSLNITASGASDPGSGVKSLTLWVKKGDGLWGATGHAVQGATGTFTFTDMTHDDTYYFDVVAEDNLGNTSATPTGNGLAATEYSSQFSAGEVSGPDYVTSGPIVLTFEGSRDLLDGGIHTIYLWVKKGEDGTWTDTGMNSPEGVGTFAYNDMSGDDTYYFGLRARNHEGTFTPIPIGSGDTWTVYDTTAPESGTLTGQEFTNATPLTLNYTGASDDGSGLKEVRLWVKRGFDGEWTNTGETATETEGSIDYPEATEEDVYHFFLQAVDNAGNESPAPTDEAVFAE